MARPLRVGFLTYDLQEFTADCLSRINHRAPFRLKAYPILPRAAHRWINFEYRPSDFDARHFTVNKTGSTPEGLMASVNFRAAHACAKENDVVVLFGIQAGTALLLTALSRLLRRKLVSVNQTLPPASERKRRWWIRWLKGWILNSCQVHVIETPAAHDNLVQVYGQDPATFIEAPFNAGLQIFQKLIAETPLNRKVLRAEFGWNEDRCVFLFVGTLLRFKGVLTILHAARLLQKKAQHFQVILCGPDSPEVGEPTIDHYRKYAKSLGIDSQVLFTGRQPLEKLPRYYCAGDVFILPTQKDCWPKVLVEAAFFGLPLITTTSCGAAGSLVENGKTGYVVPPDDPQALAHAMQSLLDVDLRRRMGEKAREFCVTFCDPEKQAQGFIRAIERAAGRNCQGTDADRAAANAGKPLGPHWPPPANTERKTDAVAESRDDPTGI